MVILINRKHDRLEEALRCLKMEEPVFLVSFLVPSYFIMVQKRAHLRYTGICHGHTCHFRMDQPPLKLIFFF